jgi:hypothetical protein
MLRPIAPRIRSFLAVAALAALVPAAVGCSSDDDGDEGADATATTTEAEAAPEPSDPDQKVALALIDEFASALEGSGFDEDTQSCIVEVARDAIPAGLEGAELDAAYQEACDVTSSAVLGGAYYAGMVEQGVEPEAAACARDLFAQLDVDEAAAMVQDEAAQQELASGCGVDLDQLQG